MSNTRVVFVSGLSGSGKSTAMAVLADLSFYCVDNLPALLIDQFMDLCEKATPPIQKIGLAIDAREARFLRGFSSMVGDLRDKGFGVEVIFLECSNQTLINRYRETRRVHPLAPGGRVAEGIEAERHLLAEVAAVADFRVDTTALNVHQLRETVLRHVSGRVRPTVVNLISFGFRYGAPQAAELLFDVRFLPNPHFEESLREKTGHDAEVSEYVLKNPVGQELFERLRELLGFLLPHYDAEGKAYLSIGIGCTGGRHRSVAIAQALGAELERMGREVNVEDRDVERQS